MVASLNKEEVRNLKLFLNRTNAGKVRKDVQLFDLMRKHGAGADEDQLWQKLYQKEDKNGFYRLKNRLLEDIGKSMTLQYYQSSDSNQGLYYLALSRLYRNKNQFKASLYYLRKAEKKAQAIAAYELLDIIYTDYIRHSQESLQINPEVYIQKRNSNRLDLNKLREIDEVLSVLIFRIKKSQNFARRNDQVIEILQKTIDDFSGSIDLEANPQLRFKIYHAVSRILLQQHDYPSLEEYLRTTLESFTRESLFNKNNHDTKLQMLTYLVNALTKNAKYGEAMEYVGKLDDAMQEHNRVLRNKYLPYYYNSKSLLYSFMQRKEEAIGILQEALHHAGINKAVPTARIIFYTNLALLHFDLANFRQANRVLVKMKLDDTYRNIDESYQLKISIVELIIRFELSDNDYIEYQAAQLRKEFGHLLEDKAYERQDNMIELLEIMIYHDRINSPRYLELVAHITDSLSIEEASDNDILSYSAWLQGRGIPEQT
ncbi:MAG: hypothetical protein AAGB22_00280 [Bacteroidota bacterium]